jgi:phosphonate transport system substrate-binding protein
VVRIIWKTPTFADYNMTAHPDLEEQFGEGFTAKLQQALLDMSDENLLAAFGRKKLIKAQNADFEGIRKVAEKLGMVR